MSVLRSQLSTTPCLDAAIEEEHQGKKGFMSILLLLQYHVAVAFKVMKAIVLQACEWGTFIFIMIVAVSRPCCCVINENVVP